MRMVGISRGPWTGRGGCAERIPGGRGRRRIPSSYRAINSAARVPPLHGGSRGFESLIAHSTPSERVTGRTCPGARAAPGEWVAGEGVGLRASAFDKSDTPQGEQNVERSI